MHSVLTLVSYRTKMITITEQGWVQQLVEFMDKFYRLGCPSIEVATAPMY